MRQLTDRELNLPYAIAARFARPGTNRFDELVSDGNEALVLAARSYREGRGNAFATWAYRYVRSRIMRSAKAGSRKVRRPDGSVRDMVSHEMRWLSLRSLDGPVGRGRYTLSHYVPARESDGQLGPIRLSKPR